MALRRKFNFSESVGLQFQADAFNIFNHPNFEDPAGNDLVLATPIRQNLAFGQSISMSGRSLSGGGFPSFYSFGGPRTMRLSVKLISRIPMLFAWSGAFLRFDDSDSTGAYCWLRLWNGLTRANYE